MAGFHQTYQLGPDTRQVSAAVTGGQLVMPDTANPGMVLPATAASTTVLGVATRDAAPYGAATQQPTPLNIGAYPNTTGIAYNPGDVDCVYSTAANDGQLLIAAANGQVAAAGVAPAGDQIVGKCTQPGGVLAGAAGRVRLYV